jgi:very-long-chain (3R)-3-hydroxyacyl-CoA dehydratase
MFYPLYPIGMGAEWWLLCRAIEPAGKIHSVIPWFFGVCAALYGPGMFAWYVGCAGGELMWDIGSYKMYTYMIKQRKKTLGSKKEARVS